MQHDAMRSRTDRTLVLLAASILLVSACGIPTSQPGGLGDEIERAADATAELDAYRIAWVADYDLSEEEVGRPALQVRGSGVIDAVSGDVESIVIYDDDLRAAAETLFPGADIDEVRAITRIVGDEVYIQGFNTAALEAQLVPEYDVWYRISERRQDLGDPFVRTDVRPADVLPVLVEPLVDAGALSVVVDRDFVLDLGTRFSRSLYDFGLRIGGGDFELSITLEDELVRVVRFDGDDPEAGVDRYVFEITFEPFAEAAVSAPDDAVTLP